MIAQYLTASAAFVLLIGIIVVTGVTIFSANPAQSTPHPLVQGTRPGPIQTPKTVGKLAKGEQAITEALPQPSDPSTQGGVPPTAGQRHDRGKALFASKRFAEAAAEFAKALELEPRKIMYRHDLGAAFLNCGRYKEAKQELSAVIASDGKFALAYANRCRVSVKVGDFESALADAQELIDLEPKSPHGYFFRATIQFYRQLFRDSINDFSQCLLLDPGFDPAYQGRVAVFLEAKNLNAAELATVLDDLGLLIERRPEELHVYKLNQGIAYYYANLPNAAIDTFSKLLSAYPRYADAYNNRAAAYQSVGNLEDAYKDLYTACELDPTSGTRRDNLKRVEAALVQERKAQLPEVRLPPKGSPEPWLNEETKKAFAEAGFRLAIYLIARSLSSDWNDHDTLYRRVHVHDYYRTDGTHVREHYRYIPVSRP